MNKCKILLFLGGALAALLLIRIFKISGAFYSSTATAKDNIFTSLAMPVVLSDTDQTEAVEITNTWKAANVLPGYQFPEGVITIKNASGVRAHHLDMTFSYTGDQQFAKNIIFNSINNGFRFGPSSLDARSINLTTTLRGTLDGDYKVFNGVTGLPIGTTDIDGKDGTTPDGKISLSELAAFGKIRIEAGEEDAPMAEQSTAFLWLDAQVDPQFSSQNASVNITVKFTLDQDASQM